MTELKCGVESCYYNKSEYCCKGEIMVEGESAESTCDTCCGSFTERGEASASNVSDHQSSDSIDVGCDAVKCSYNDDYKCSADKIGIAGHGACECSDTECATFRCR